MIEMTTLLVACRRTKPPTTSDTPNLDIAISCSADRFDAAGTDVAEFRASISAVTAMFSRATAATAMMIAALPKVPMMSVASGGPATHATETSALVFTTLDGLTPECRRKANSRETPTPAGPPNTTSAMTAMGSDDVTPRTTASASVSNPQASMGRR